jgi:hypothetical protein
MAGDLRRLFNKILARDMQHGGEPLVASAFLSEQSEKLP